MISSENKTSERDTYLEIPCAITRDPVTIHALSRGIEIFSRLVLDVSRKEGVLHDEFNAFNRISVVEHEGVLGGISRQ
jgi:hypothetical protein